MISLAGGTFGGGDGSQTNPYLIEDAADLDMVRSYPDKSFKLTENINVGVSPYNNGAGWTPINGFKGYFDGNGKKIYNLYINRPAEDNVGLFGLLETKNRAESFAIKICNLVLENVNVTGHNCVGALVGDFRFLCDLNREDNDEFLNNIAVSGKIVGNKMIGGLLGRCYQTFATIANLYYCVMNNCYTSATISPIAGGDYVGQLIGQVVDANEPAGFARVKCIYLRNCVGIASLRPDGGTPPIHIGNMVCGGKISFQNCFLDGNKWLCELESGHTGLTIATTADMKDISKISVMTQSVNADGYPYWSLEEDRYPELSCNCDDYLFVYGDGQYFIYDFASNDWISRGQSEPTVKEAVIYGMRRLEHIPSAAWDAFKTKSNPCIINIMDKASSEETKIKSMNIARDTTNSSDRAIFRKKFNFNEDSGVLSAINI